MLLCMYVHILVKNITHVSFVRSSFLIAVTLRNISVHILGKNRTIVNYVIRHFPIDRI